jgi:putative transposase
MVGGSRRFLTITCRILNKGIYQAIDAGITKLVTAVNVDCKFFEIRTTISDQYWKPKLYPIKSRRDHCKDIRKVLYNLKNTFEA